MIIGEAPGAEEWKHKRPFVGDAGRFLTEALGEACLDRADVYITNTVKVFPPIDGRSGKRKSPSAAQIRDALPYLIEEIQHVAPKQILALGTVAYRCLTRSTLGITRGREKSWHRLDEMFDCSDVLVLPTYHPSYIKQYGRKFRDVWRRDLAEFSTRISASPKDDMSSGRLPPR